jgi:hypothetical protein
MSYDKGCDADKFSIILNIGYSDKLLIPIYFIHKIHDLKLLKGDIYNQSLTYSKDELDLRIVATELIKPYSESKEAKDKHRAEYRIKLEQELKALDIEEAKI